jgi:hypothetical protein
VLQSGVSSDCGLTGCYTMYMAIWVEIEISEENVASFRIEMCMVRN